MIWFFASLKERFDATGLDSSHSHRPTWAVDKTWPHLACHRPCPTGPPGESRSHSSLPSRGLHAPRGLPLQGVCAAIDDSVIDLGAYGRLDSWRALVLLWRGLRSLRKVLSGCIGCCSCRRTTEASRHIQDQGVIRPLDPDSESEAEQITDPCEAVLIGLELQGKPRALAPEGCEDKAAAEPTRFLLGSSAF